MHNGYKEDVKSSFKFRDWNVDLIPKFLMANGRLVQLLIHTGKYLRCLSPEHYTVMLLMLL